MCDKDTCNDASCCGECEPWNCLEQQVNDILATKEGQLQGYVDESKNSAAESKASAEASAQSAAESKEFRDEAETAASTAVAAEGVVLGVASTLQDTADKLGTAIAGIAVVTWYYTAVSENQTVIPVPDDKNQIAIQAIYIEGARKEPGPSRDFTYDPVTKQITLVEGIPLGQEIAIILGVYPENSDDITHILASSTGAGLIGTTSGFTAQEELNANSGSFQDGAKLLNKNNRIIDRSTNPAQLYIWDGLFPKAVPVGSTPETSGGVGVGAWISVGDAALRSELAMNDGAYLSGYGSMTVGSFLDEMTNATLITAVVTDLNANNRDAIYAHDGYVYVPRGVTVRCNFLPADDVRKFVGHGRVTTTDPWGYTHTFDVELANTGSKITARQIVAQGIKQLQGPGWQQTTIGTIGDSITDGSAGDNFTFPNPIDADGNLSSTNYDHGSNPAGGMNSWFHHFVNTVNLLAGYSEYHNRNICTGYNAARSGMGINSGWAYRNFDFGFFQNAAYGNKAPEVLLVSMGTNDVGQVFTKSDCEAYIDKLDALIAKANGYGCKVVLVSMTHFSAMAPVFYDAVMTCVQNNHPNVEFLNLADDLKLLANSSIGFYNELFREFDAIHPKTLAHQFLGGALARRMLPDRVFSIQNGDNVRSAQSGSVQAFMPLLDDITPFGIDVSANWLLPETIWPIYQTSSGTDGSDITIRHFVWVERVTQLYIVEPHVNYYESGAIPGASAKIMYPCLAGEARSRELELASNLKASFDGFLVTECDLLWPGLNVIDVKYSSVINAYAPILQFREPNWRGEFGPMRIKIPSGSANLYSNNTQTHFLQYMSFNASSPLDPLPDAGRGVRVSDWLITFAIKRASIGVAVAAWFHQFLGTSIAVFYKSATSIEVCRMTSGILKEVIAGVTGNFSSDWHVQFAQASTGSIVNVIDSTGVETITAITGVSGGSIGIINLNGEAAELVVAGVSVELPRNGHIVI
ncbi:tail fiber protein [Pectobacterium phage Nepra]|uniref:Tail fiber protein n=1 Tax=Pectobacterium phage Nepra TaxID=2163635 RepID=A0A2S1GT36_9CAUD|nr:virion structural protein [Pectobacterium phage Nepra]AWD92560.1 tail fiber protein [Pectobacterium phage Nepra]